MKSVFVLGGINMDYIIHVDKIPSPGESKPGYDFLYSQGGKGANQAIAAKKLGVNNVYMIASLGDDYIKDLLLKSIKSYDIDISGVQINGDTSPTCMITFDDSIKDNFVIINDGSNILVNKYKVESFLKEKAKPGDIFMTVLENNVDAVYHSLLIAKSLNMYTIFNAAPAQKLDDSIYKYADLLVVNESECYTLSGIKVINEEDAIMAYNFFYERGTEDLIITLGDKGSYYIKDSIVYYTKALIKDTVDTTSAGDTFIGAIASRLSLGDTITNSLKFSSVASSITVSRKGSSISIPSLDEVLSLIDKNK